MDEGLVMRKTELQVYEDRKNTDRYRKKWPKPIEYAMLKGLGKGGEYDKKMR